MRARSERPALWIFGYGSLVWRPDFPFEERRSARVRGWQRRFWQGSTDHRGVPGAPGRVVTLVRMPGAECLGIAYRIAQGVADAVLDGLDHREKGGYERHRVTLEWSDAAHAAHAARGAGELRAEGPSALVYVASRDNPNHLGPLPTSEVADQVVASAGPSGPNSEYVLRLADALRTLGADDPHVFEVERAVRTRLGGGRGPGARREPDDPADSAS